MNKGNIVSAFGRLDTASEEPLERRLEVVVVDRRKGISGLTQAGAAAYPVLDGDIQAQLGKHLKAMYESLLVEPMPGRFVELLNELDRRERDTSRAPGAEPRE